MCKAGQRPLLALGRLFSILKFMQGSGPERPKSRGERGKNRSKGDEEEEEVEEEVGRFGGMGWKTRREIRGQG